MTPQELSDLQKVAINWWLELVLLERIKLAKKYIGTSNLQSLTHLEIMYCYLYFKEENTLVHETRR